jgi:hypothetical protein
MKPFVVLLLSVAELVAEVETQAVVTELRHLGEQAAAVAVVELLNAILARLSHLL